MMFGREPCLSIQSETDATGDSDIDDEVYNLESVDRVIATLQSIHSTIKSKATDNIQKAQKKQKEQYDRKTLCTSFDRRRKSFDGKHCSKTEKKRQNA